MQVFIGGEFESQSVHNMTRLVDLGNRYGIPVLGVTAVGSDMVRDAQYMRLASRICAELGARVREDLLRGRGLRHRGGLVPGADRDRRRQEDARSSMRSTMAYRAVQEGALGVDMGRNIFQSEHPVAMIQAVRKVVHDGEKAGGRLRLLPVALAEAGAGAGRGALIERRQGEVISAAPPRCCRRPRWSRRRWS